MKSDIARLDPVIVAVIVGKKKDFKSYVVY